MHKPVVNRDQNHVFVHHVFFLEISACPEHERTWSKIILYSLFNYLTAYQNTGSETKNLKKLQLFSDICWRTVLTLVEKYHHWITPSSLLFTSSHRYLQPHLKYVVVISKKIIKVSPGEFFLSRHTFGVKIFRVRQSSSPSTSSVKMLYWIQEGP